MSALTTAALRLARTALHLTRLAVRQLGPFPVALALTAAATLLYLVRNRPPPPPPPRRRRAPEEPSAPGEGPRWLSRVRRVTFGARWSKDVRCDSFHAVEGRVRMREEVVPYLHKLAKRFDLYFITEVDDDHGEKEVTEALRDAGLFDTGLLDERKVLFCETDLGRVSVARQIDPQLHVDESSAVIAGLHRFVPWVALVSANAQAPSAPSARNITKCTSLAAFYS